jgi:hypothetical protein
LWRRVCSLQLKTFTFTHALHLSWRSVSCCVAQAPQLRHAFSELDFADAELLTFHAGVRKDPQGNPQETLSMSAKSVAHLHFMRSHVRLVIALLRRSLIERAVFCSLHVCSAVTAVCARMSS